MSSTGDQEQAVGNGLAHTNVPLQKRHSSGEHVNVSWFTIHSLVLCALVAIHNYVSWERFKSI